MNGTAAPIPPNHIEHGREYHGFRRGIYMFPCDEEEKDRMDIYHKLFLVARNDQLHKAPLIPNYDGPRILDLGTGTGIWAIDMAEYPEAEVIIPEVSQPHHVNSIQVVGLDLVNIQPSQIPPNLRFRIPRDYESTIWSLGEDSFDLIHLRMGCGGVSSWPEMYHKIFRHLKPGYGHIEQVEIDLRPRCDDGTLPPGNSDNRKPTPIQMIEPWYGYIEDATNRASRPIQYPHETCEMLRAQGFVDVEETVIRLPVNSWPVNRHERDIGRWYNLGMCEGLDAMSLAPLTRMFEWSVHDVRRLVVDVKKGLCNTSWHVYNNLHIITARRP